MLLGERGERGNLAGMYETGQALEKYFTKAQAWYTQVAEKGLVIVREHLSVMYAAGARIERDYLAPILEKGQGLEQYYTKTKEWYVNAAKRGVATAKLRLSGMDQAGDTVEQNSEKAIAEPGQAEE